MSVSHVGLRHLLSWSACLALVASPALAAAKPKGKPACVVAFEQAQEKRRKGRLMAAREQLLSCARRSCGDVVQRECTTMLDQVRIETPTVVFAVTDARGELLTDVQVKMDGRVITSRLDGRALSVDPGTHVFSFSTPEGQSAEQQSTIFEGAASQRVAVTFPPREVLEPAPETDATSKGEAKSESKADPGDVNDEKRADTRVRTDDAVRSDEAALAAPPPKSESKKKRARGSAETVEARPRTPVLPYVFAGVGVASLGSFFALGAMRNSAERDLRKCWPSCSDDRLDNVKRLAVAANVSLGVSAAAFATGAVLFFTGGLGSRQEKQARRKANTAYALDVESSPAGVVAKVTGSF